jgi:hypothetical protein
MMELPDKVTCPKCHNQSPSYFDDYDIDCGEPFPEPGTVSLYAQCPVCDHDWKFEGRVKFEQAPPDADLMAPALFQKLWKRIYRPKSGCPDVEVGHVLRVMVELLVDTNLLTDCGSEAENWALAYVTIMENAHPGDIRAGWTDTVPYYLDERDEQGYPKPRPFEEYDADLSAKDSEMAQALRTLVAKGILVEDEEKLRRV